MKEWLILFVFSVVIYGIQLSKVESQTYVYKSLEQSIEKFTEVSRVGLVQDLKLRF